jgi:hypothetical protein
VLKTPPNYRVYLLRLWEEHTPAAAQRRTWRFSLEDLETGRRHGFTTLRDLLAFLEQRLDERPTDEPGSDPVG